MRDRLGYARARLSVYGHGAAVRPQTHDVIWDGVKGLWGRVAPLLSPWCARGNVPTGVNLNWYSGSGSCIPWHSDNESLFGPPNKPMLIVSMSSHRSVVFQVRRASSDVHSSITLDHGDLLVMDGSAQSKCAHRTVPGLHGPRVNLTYRWVAPHCVLSTSKRSGLCSPNMCAMFSRAQVPVGLVKGKINGPLLWDGPPLVNPGGCPSGQHLDSHLEGGIVTVVSIHPARRCTSPLGVVPVGLGGRRWALSRRRQSSKKVSFYFPFVFFAWEKTVPFF